MPEDHPTSGAIHPSAHRHIAHAEPLGQVSSVRIRDSPHSSDNASKSGVTHRRRKIKDLISDTLFRDYRSEIVRKESGFGIRKSRAWASAERDGI